MKVMWTSSSTLSRSKMWRLMVSPSTFFLPTLSELGGGGGGGGGGDSTFSHSLYSCLCNLYKLE